MALGPVMLDVEGLQLTPADRDLLADVAVAEERVIETQALLPFLRWRS